MRSRVLVFFSFPPFISAAKMVLLANLSTFSKVDFKYLGMCDDSTGLVGAFFSYSRSVLIQIHIRKQ